MVVEDEGWHTGQLGEAGRAEKDVEMALLFPFAPTGTPSLPSDDGGAHYFTAPNPNPPGQRRRPEQLDWRTMLSPPQQSQCTAESVVHDHRSSAVDATVLPAHSPMSGYQSLGESDFASEDPYFYPTSPTKAAAAQRSGAESGEFEGLEGIYKFLQVCEEARR